MAPRGSRRNARTGLLLTGIVAGMVGLSFAAVPLYRLFCQVTGYGGTTQVADAVPATVSERTITVRFNADVDPQLPWSFAPEQRAVTVKVGEPGLAFYRARNRSEQTTVGAATFNVTPLKAGQYFNKVQCFCFDEQALDPGQEAEMGVSFFVDPAILEDRNLDEVKTITLSYTFFRAPDDRAPDAASREEDRDAGRNADVAGAAAAARTVN